ncbi:TetR/AcrR family transcriptional regulator [Embleya sp. NPDC055664]
MVDPPATAPPPARRRRADARRSIGAILDAARVVLGERPDASMEDIAGAAGVTRQTVYAHFPSRDALVAGLVESAAAEYAGLLDEADLDTAPPVEALTRFLDAGWRFLDRYPLLVNAGAPRIPRPIDDPHDFAPPRLKRLLQRGQDAGDFAPTPPAAWLAPAIFALQHAAVAETTTGRLTRAEAQTLCLQSTLRLCGANPDHR